MNGEATTSSKYIGQPNFWDPSHVSSQPQFRLVLTTYVMVVLIWRRPRASDLQKAHPSKSSIACSAATCCSGTLVADIFASTNSSHPRRAPHTGCHRTLRHELRWQHLPLLERTALLHLSCGSCCWLTPAHTFVRTRCDRFVFREEKCRTLIQLPHLVTCLFQNSSLQFFSPTTSSTGISSCCPCQEERNFLVPNQLTAPTPGRDCLSKTRPLLHLHCTLFVNLRAPRHPIRHHQLSQYTALNG